MDAALTVLLIGCLLQTALCGQFKTIIPQTIKVLSGSCVTIPCSFDVEDQYISHIDGTCRALWKSDEQTVVFDSSNPQSSAIQGELKGDLTRRDCNTTLNNMRPEHSKEYLLRVQCDQFKYNFLDQKLHISVTDDPPTPTLTPSTLKVEEGTSVSLKCSAPAPCLSHPPALTWTSSLGHIQESLQENLDRTKVQTSVLTFTASRLHHGKIISCTAVYSRQDGSSQSVSTSLTADVLSEMAAALTVLLIGCLLQTALCGWTEVFIPQTIKVLSGSCVTIPCSFDVVDEFISRIDGTCRALWKSDKHTIVFDSSYPQSSAIQGELKGDLTRRDCSTTLNNMRPEHSKEYLLRVQCDQFRNNFLDQKLHISVTDDPPTPTLTPSTLKVEEGTSVSLKCSAPAPCLSHPPALTWTSSLGHIQDSLQENLDRTKVQTSVLTFTASRLHHGKIISCTAVYSKQDGSSQSVSTSLTADVLYSPKNTTVSVSPSGPVPENSRVTLTCSSTANPAVRSYTWYRADGGQEVFMGTGNVLDITASEVGASFFCKAENDLGAERSDTRQIEVQYSPKHTTVSVSPSGPVPEDTGVTMTCSSSANPAVKNYTWYRADGGQETFIGAGHVLNIKTSTVNGPFFCKAENVLGAGQSNISQIDVQCMYFIPVYFPYTLIRLTVFRALSHILHYLVLYYLDIQFLFKMANSGNTCFDFETQGGLSACHSPVSQHCLSQSLFWFSPISVYQFRNGPCFCIPGRKKLFSCFITYSSDSPKHTTVSVSPSGPVPENSIVTLTCSSTANPAVKNYTWYRADGGQETVMGTGHVLNIKASRDSGPFFCEAENPIGSERSNISQIDVHFAPQILSSYGCIQTADQLNCFCETVGNPPPALQWYLDGLPVNHSDRFAISSEPLNVSGLRSIITVSQLQQRDLSTLLCHSSNSLGSATQRFLVYSLEPHGPELYLGPYSGLLLLAGAAVSLCVNVLLTIYVVLLCKARKSVKPKEEDRTYMSLDQMAAALTVLLIGCLLQTALCGRTEVFIPQTIKVLSGSCVTIPCSFDVEDQYISRIDGTCRALWKSDKQTVVFDSSNPQSSAIQGELKGDLTRRDCNTTLNNMRPEHSKEYLLRVQCDQFKNNFLDQKLHISVTDDPPTPTLSPSTLKVEEGTSVSLKCSAPAPCLSHPPALTWTSSLGHIQESLQENQDRTKVQTSVLTFTASRLHHGKIISCTAVYSREDGSSQSVSTSLTADVSYSPKNTTVSVSPSGPVPENSRVTLTCSSTANPAVRSYTWYRADGGQEVFMGTGNVLDITASEVGASFFCKAENDLGAERSDTRQIEVQYSPKHTTVSVSPSGPVPEDTGVTLTCSSSANPAVKNYTWYRADGGQETFIGAGHVLNIKASTVNGPFFCKAENVLGAGRSNISQIDVQCMYFIPVYFPYTLIRLTVFRALSHILHYLVLYYLDIQFLFKMANSGNTCCNYIYQFRNGPCFCIPGRKKLFSCFITYSSDSPKHTTVSVSPSGPVPENSIVTLTCSSTANPAVKNYTWYRADGDQETVMGTGHVLNINSSRDSGPFFCEAENPIGSGRSNISQIDVHFAPQILSSYGCIQTADQLNCSCETVGNPSPALQWYLDGLRVNHSDRFAISSEPLNVSGLRSIITVSQPQQRDFSTLLCHSSNSLGSATQRFCVYNLQPQISAKHQDFMVLLVFIAIIVALFLVICGLLLVIRAQRTHQVVHKSTGAMSQVLTSGEANEEPNAEEEAIYINANKARQGGVAEPAANSKPNSANLPGAGPNNAEGAAEGSEKKKEEGSDVIYSTVNWKTKSKKKKEEDSVDKGQPGNSYLEEERCAVGAMSRNFVSDALEMGNLYDEFEPRPENKAMECEYAQVKFKRKSVLRK
ncbi:sialoadhesin-like [Acanthopagrus schlegelii]